MRAIIFDTETSGLVENDLMPLDKQPYIIELCAFLVDDEVGPEPIEQLDFLCRPPVRLDPVITRITGLTDRDLADKPTFAEYMDAVRAFWSKADTVVAHNLPFDYAMLNFEFKRRNAALEWPAIKCCTVANTEHMAGHRLKLIELHKMLFDVTFESAHRARYDVAALARCWVELRKRGEL